MCVCVLCERERERERGRERGREKVTFYTIIDQRKLLLCTLGFVLVRVILEREPEKQNMNQVYALNN